MHWGQDNTRTHKHNPRRKEEKGAGEAEEDKSRGCHTLCKSGERVT